MRQKIALLITVLMILIWQSNAYAEDQPSQKNKSQNGTLQISPGQQSLAPINLSGIAVRLDSIDATTTDFKKKLEEQTPWSAIIGMIGVFVGGMITAFTSRFTQNNLLKHERRLADEKAKLEIGATTVQWQLKQLSELYGPLHALLQQSNVIYRHMNTVLVDKDEQRFELSPDPETDEIDKKIFKIKVDGRWIQFRTVMHIKEVYGKTYGIEDYFDELVEIGGRIEKVITGNAGYAQPNSAELAKVFGKYLAHYSILVRLHSPLKAERDALIKKTGFSVDASINNICVDESAVFPQKIQYLVEQDFSAINDELQKWRDKAKA